MINALTTIMALVTMGFIASVVIIGWFSAAWDTIYERIIVVCVLTPFAAAIWGYLGYLNWEAMR